MKRFKLIVPSFVAIIFCMLLIAGSTFALFTSQATASISVNSGKVEVKAELTNLKLYSADATLTEGDLAGEITEETVTKYNEGTPAEYTESYENFVGKYYFNEQTDSFANGGTAQITNNVLSIDKMTPGDKVTLKLDSTNKSNVNVKVRLNIEVSHLNDDDDALLSQLVFRLGDREFVGLKSYTSAWKYYTAGAATDDYDLEVELPLLTNNTAQSEDPEHPRTVTFAFTLMAVQGNAATSGAETIDMYDLKVQNFENTTAKEVATPIIDSVDPTSVTFSDKQVVAEVEDTEVKVTSVAPAALLEAAYNASVTANPEAENHDVKVDLYVSDLNVKTDSEEKATISVDIELKINDVKVENSEVDVPVEIYIGTGMYIEEFKHNGVTLTLAASKDALQTNQYYYDSVLGNIYFKTKSFSPFEIVYTNGKSVQTFAELKEALTHDHITVKMLNNITVDSIDTLEIAEGTKLDGNGYTLSFSKWFEYNTDFITLAGNDIIITNLNINANNFDTYNSEKALINVNLKDNITLSYLTLTTRKYYGYKALSFVAGGVTIDHVNASGFFGFIYQSGMGGDETQLVRDLSISNCTLDVVYTLNFGSGNKTAKMVVSNSEIHGWTSYGADISKVEFNNVNFSKGTVWSYDYMRAYSDTTFNSCSFDEEYEISANYAVKFVLNNCTYNNSPVTNTNIQLSDDEALEKCLFVIDNKAYQCKVNSDTGVYYKNGEIYVLDDVESTFSANTIVSVDDKGLVYFTDGARVALMGPLNKLAWNDVALNIPEGVTEVYPLAFYQMGIKSLTCPSTLKKIGSKAFAYESSTIAKGNMTTLKLNEGLEEIGSRAFKAQSITSLELPSTLTVLDGAFYQCTEIAGVLVIPGSITIFKDSFSNCTKIEKIIIEEGVTAIPNNAFRGSESTGSLLREITIPSTVTSIGSSAFRDCSSLETINLNSTTLPDGMPTNAFTNAANQKRADGVELNINVRNLEIFLQLTNQSSDNYVATKEMSTWCGYDVSAQKKLYINTFVNISTTDELKSVLDKGIRCVLLTQNINTLSYTFTHYTVIDGQGLYEITGGNALRWCYLSNNPNVRFQNLTLRGGTYGYHFDNGDGTLTFENCSIYGWNSASSPIRKIEFYNCNFNMSTGEYACIRFYQSGLLYNCQFSDDFEWIDTNYDNVEIKLVKCKNITSSQLFKNDSSFTNVKFYIDGALVEEITAH